jgi:RNA polymerase sigma-70 factor (ECF subfamily)
MSSFEQQFERARPQLLGLALVLTRDDLEAAEDLVQECALRAFRKFDSYLGQQPFEHWIRRILTHLFLNQAEVAENRPEEVSLEAMLEDGMDMEDPSALSEECFALLDSVHSLPPAQLTVICALAEGGPLSAPVDRKRKSRATAALREALN